MTNEERVKILVDGILASKPRQDLEWDREEQAYYCMGCGVVGKPGVNEFLAHKESCPVGQWDKAIQVALEYLKERA